MSKPLPRLFVFRHGETEWSRTGRHTGRTDIPLTERGVEQVKTRAQELVGEGKTFDPKNICTAFVSPRQRAHSTFHILFEHVPKVPDHIFTEEVREWDYGEYEGLKTAEIVQRKPNWSIWTDGCPGGESAEDMRCRVDIILAKVREYHKQYWEEDRYARDVLIVAHGHFIRALIPRWINAPLPYGAYFDAEPGGLAVFSYSHHSLQEPVVHALNL